jgi:hypothetical protein
LHIPLLSLDVLLLLVFQEWHQHKLLVDVVAIAFVLFFALHLRRVVLEFPLVDFIFS